MNSRDDYVTVMFFGDNADELSVQSVVEAQKLAMAFGAQVGDTMFVERRCGPRHRRAPNQTIIFDYQFIERIWRCPICGLIVKKRRLWKRLSDFRRKVADGQEAVSAQELCCNPICLRYQSVPEYSPETGRDRLPFDDWVITQRGNFRESNTGLRLSRFDSDWWPDRWLMPDVSQTPEEYMPVMAEYHLANIMAIWGLSQDEEAVADRYFLATE